MFTCVSPFSTSLVTQFFAVSILKHSRTPANTLGMMEYQNNDHEQLMKRLRSAQSVDEVLTQSSDMLSFSCSCLDIAIMATAYNLCRSLILLPPNKPLGHLMSFLELLFVHYIKDQQWQAWIFILPFILYLLVGWNRLVYSCIIKKFSCHILILENHFWNSWLRKRWNFTLGSRAEREADIKDFQDKGYCCLFCLFSGL